MNKDNTAQQFSIWYESEYFQRREESLSTPRENYVYSEARCDQIFIGQINLMGNKYNTNPKDTRINKIELYQLVKDGRPIEFIKEEHPAFHDYREVIATVDANLLKITTLMEKEGCKFEFKFLNTEGSHSIAQISYSNGGIRVLILGVGTSREFKAKDNIIIVVPMRSKTLQKN